MKLKQLIFTALITLAITACGKDTSPPTSTNHLSMTLNGTPWIADNNIWGAFHPAGYNQAIIISGSKGPKDKNEQAFNLNLYNTPGPGTYQIAKGNPDNNVIQLANLTPENYLYGSLMGYNVKVTITKASSNPTIIEATFEGEMSGNASDTLKITNGKFTYRE